VTPENLAATGKYADYACKIIPRSMADLPPIPEIAKPLPGAYVAETMNDFEWGDSLVYPKGKAPEIPNITQLGPRTFNFWLRHRGDPTKDKEAWYDGDRELGWNNKGKDKSRVELSNIAPSRLPYQMGETWLLGTTVRLNPDFVPFAGYCDIMQPIALQSFLELEKIQGDIVTGHLKMGTPGNKPWVRKEGYVIREFKMKRGEWTTFVLRIKIAKDGEYALSVNGDDFKSMKLDTTMSDKGRPPYSGTWGLYGSGTYDVNKKPLRDSVIQHTNMWCKKIAG